MSASEFQVGPGKRVIPHPTITGVPGISIQLESRGGIRISDTANNRVVIFSWQRVTDLKAVIVSAARELGLEIEPSQSAAAEGTWEAKAPGTLYSWTILDRGGLRALKRDNQIVSILAQSGDPYGIAEIHESQVVEVAAALCKACWAKENEEFTVPGFAGARLTIQDPPTKIAFIEAPRASEHVTLSPPNITLLYAALEEAEALNRWHAAQTNGVEGANRQ